jgi:hypothetical protein
MDGIGAEEEDEDIGRAKTRSCAGRVARESQVEQVDWL